MPSKKRPKEHIQKKIPFKEKSKTNYDKNRLRPLNKIFKKKTASQKNNGLNSLYIILFHYQILCLYLLLNSRLQPSTS